MTDRPARVPVLPRFYHPGAMRIGEAVSLPDTVAHHALRVLRLKPGAGLVLFNGEGGEFEAALVRCGAQGAEAVVERHLDVERESPLDITLAQAICAGEKMDWIVQKAVELGVCRIQPLMAERSTVRLAGMRAERRLRHWRQIAISACEQCGRNRIPPVAPSASLPEWLDTCRTERAGGDGTAAPRFILLPAAERGLRDLSGTSSPRRLILMVGPEGGLAPGEVAAALASGWIPLRLGRRTLRTESAALAAVAGMQALWGDY
ncbi:16S rRNA (uracil(1498)-N(3))-methyltransferase [Nitrosovibrio sp. Nv17]|jgi:16S rRNA (uracil1498-N3)-methyltransferase|uniref:16S rRNA (uracil(1498)-N(3))-methyltransferase n=1 Tax=Nitrosovibrio sp. Nv17 TaxID=1855339 RepID=UPI0009088803|nr:16S rRNA (uracil(1498)-N(3))-methyltransferase [Nitrosovibrio sp. Nv17]SFW11262.1 16S rRNA (uracil1498-N3)-methyltransferase [Nitrosovibrio sp. Nv17]